MRGLRQLLIWVLRAVVFILLFGLALKNSEMVELHFFFGQRWQLPVSLLVLGSFGLGALLGLSAAFSRSIGQRIQERHD